MVGNLLDKLHLGIFSRSLVIKNSRQHLLLRTDILQKTMTDMPLLIHAMISVASKPNDLVENARRNIRPPVLMERLTIESRCCKSREVIFGRVYVPTTTTRREFILAKM